MQIAKKIVPGRGNSKEEGPGKFWRQKVHVAGMWSARGESRIRVREATRDWIAWGLQARETYPHLLHGVYVTLADQ